MKMQNLGQLIEENISDLIKSKVKDMDKDIDSIIDAYLDKLFSGRVYGKEVLAEVSVDTRFIELCDSSPTDRRMAYSRFSYLLNCEISNRLAKKLEEFRVVNKFTDYSKTTLMLVISAK